MSDGSFPSSPPPPPPVTPIVTSGRSWWQSWWLITGASVVLIVGASALIASAVGGDEDDTAAPAADRTLTTDPRDDPPPTDATPDDVTSTDPATIDDDNSPITPPPSSDPPTTDPPADDPPAPDPPAPDQPAPNPPSDIGQATGAPVGSGGDRLAPVAPGEIADIGGGWRLQVLGLVEDGTDLVLAENQFNDPPRAGTKFTLIDIALGYYGLDDPSNAFVPTISGVASASIELDDGCGVVPGDFRTFAEVFSGGVLRGTLCFVTTTADDGTVQLYATNGFDGPDVFLAAAAPATPPEMPTLPGPQPGATATPARLDPTPIGTPVDVGEGWTFTVTSPATDVTDVVAAENQFNDPPPDGFRFVGIDVEYRYAGTDISSAFEVSTKMVGTTNVEIAKGCGVIPDPVDTFADVFPGGVVTGSLCYVTPIDDVGTLVLYTSTAFGEEPVFFSTGDDSAGDNSAG